MSLFTDASLLKGFGFLLCQLQKDGSTGIIPTGSSSVTGAKARYSLYNMEIVGAVFTMEKSRFYLVGGKDSHYCVNLS